MFGQDEEGALSEDALDLDQDWQQAQLTQGGRLLKGRLSGILQELAYLVSAGFWDGMYHERHRTGLPTDDDRQWDDLTPEDQARVRQFNTIVGGMPLQQRADLVDGLAAIISGHMFASSMGAEADSVIERVGRADATKGGAA